MIFLLGFRRLSVMVEKEIVSLLELSLSLFLSWAALHCQAHNMQKFRQFYADERKFSGFDPWQPFSAIRFFGIFPDNHRNCQKIPCGYYLFFIM